VSFGSVAGGSRRVPAGLAKRGVDTEDASVEFRVLGPVQVLDGSAVGLAVGKQMALLACLLIARGEVGIARSNLGDIDGGISCHGENAEISRRLGDGIRLSAALNNLGYCLLRRGRYDRATALFEEGLAVCRQIGHRTAESVMLGNLGLAALLEHRPADALGLFRLGLAIDRELGYAEGLIYGLVGIAAALSELDTAPDAARLLAAAQAAAGATAVELEPLEVEVEVVARTTAALEATLTDEQLARARADGAALSLDDAVEHALSAVVSG